MSATKIPSLFYTLAMIIIGIIIASISVYSLTLDKKEETISKKDYISYFEIAVWELIRREDISLEPYYCPAGHLTVGVGHRTENEDVLTLKEVKDQLYTDLQDRYDIFEKLLPKHSRNEIMAVSLFAHNIGINKLLNSPQWERIKNKTSDCEYYWSKYVYYFTPSKKPMVSENLKKARNLEISLWQNSEELFDIREYLREEASKRYSKLYTE